MVYGLALVVNAVLSQSYVVDSGDHTSNNNALRAMVAVSFVFSFFTFTSIISCIYPAEIFTIEIRAKGKLDLGSCELVLKMAFCAVYSYCTSKSGLKFFYFFFALNIVAAVCYILFFREAKEKTLEQMDGVFGDPLVRPAASAAMGEMFHIDHVKDH